jgi:hypothetical protein
VRLAASRRGPRLLTSSRRKGVGVRLATPALKKYPPIRAVARRTNAGRLAPTQRSAAGEASDGIPGDAGASLDPTWGSSLAGQCRRRRHAGRAYASNAIGQNSGTDVGTPKWQSGVGFDM